MLTNLYFFTNPPPPIYCVSVCSLCSFLDLITFFSPSHTLRGSDAGDMVVCDEMAFMQDKMFHEVIIPLLGMENAKLLGISTPSPDEYNFFTHMLTLKYPGTDRHVFGNLVIDLACDDCKRRNRAVDCRHLQGFFIIDTAALI